MAADMDGSQGGALMKMIFEIKLGEYLELLKLCELSSPVGNV